MDENKNKEQQSSQLTDLLSAIMRIPQSEAYKKFVNNIKIIDKNLSDWVKSVDWEQISKNIKALSKLTNDIQEQLKERNIDFNTICDLDAIDLIELYSRSYDVGIHFGDMVEDNLKLFKSFEYTNALIYLDIIEKRQNQIAENKQKPTVIDDDNLKKLKYIGVDFENVLKVALIEYENGTIHISDVEKTLLKQLKDNSYLTNKNLAEILGYTDRGIEDICRRIREKFYINDSDDTNIKRKLLITLAKQIKID